MRYLKPNIVIEPLIEGWYAWAHLIFPPTAALNVVNRHLKIIRSFIKSPSIHEAAVRDPRMAGGPFMNISRIRVNEVKQLETDTVDHQDRLLALAEAIKELNQLIRAEAKGYSLNAVYGRIPHILKGYVELVYDTWDQPNYRFIEPLIYGSEFNTSQYQSIALWETDNDERPFVLSTPKLPSSDTIVLHVPFRDNIIDELAKSKRKGITDGAIEVIKIRFNFDAHHTKLFDSFFCEDTPCPYDSYKNEKARMRYFGHACILLETRDVNILVDPLISYYGYQSDVSRFSELDLPEKIDFVLITHNHQDHVLFETLLSIRHKIGQIIVPRSGRGFIQDPNLKRILNDIGFSNVVEIDEMENLSIGHVIITGIPFMGEHSDLNVQTKLCYLVKVRQFSFLFCADSCNIEPQLYERIAKITSGVDVLFLGMECDGAPLSWLYGPLLPSPPDRELDNSRRLAGSNFEQGRNLVDVFNPKEVYVYAMGMEPWLKFISSINYTAESNPIIESNKLISYCHDRGMIAERLFGEKELLYTVRNPVEA
jgi:L-ascorbate metabolism protein UlaG (beta-lactamase superfamily)